MSNFILKIINFIKLFDLNWTYNFYQRRGVTKEVTKKVTQKVTQKVT